MSTVNVLKFLTPKFSDKMPYTNSADLDQIRVFTVCHSTKHFKRQMHKKQNLRHKSME